MSNLPKTNYEADFNVFEKEPLTKLIVYLKGTPITVSISFFFTVSVTLTASAYLSAPIDPSPDYIGYFENVSWSIPMLFIFPFIVGLILKYYLEIPKLFSELAGPRRDDEKYNLFLQWIDKWFNNYITPASILLVTIYLNADYYYDIFNHEHASWITNGSILKGLFKEDAGFSLAGMYSAIIQITLIYWLFNLVWNSFIFSWGLHKFFNVYNFDVTMEPLHPDGCCGLKRIGEVASLFNTALFLLGIYVSLKVIDKIVIQGLPLSSDIGNPAFLGCYVILAPLLFFLPLSSAHQKMKHEKERFLMNITERYQEHIRKIKSDYNPELVKEIRELDSLYIDLKKRIPVWPFNFKSLGAFFGSVIVPVLPVVLPFISKVIKNLFEQYS